MRVTVARIDDENKVRIVLTGTPEEHLAVQRAAELGTGDVVVVDRETYLDLMRSAQQGNAAWDATADALDAALRQVVNVPENVKVTWTFPAGSKVPVYALMWTYPTSTVFTGGLADPGRAFAGFVHRFADQGHH